MRKQRLFMICIIWLIGIALSACNSQDTTGPVEQEQIENVVKDYVVRDTNIPNYEVTIEATTKDWARVSLAPAQVEGETTTLYLQKQVEDATAPTAVIAAEPGHEARTKTTSGWAIILGPQSNFSEAELDRVGVPAGVRP